MYLLQFAWSTEVRPHDVLAEGRNSTGSVTRLTWRQVVKSPVGKAGKSEEHVEEILYRGFNVKSHQRRIFKQTTLKYRRVTTVNLVGVGVGPMMTEVIANLLTGENIEPQKWVWKTIFGIFEMF